jgi:methionine biosynthesis protein MetW
MKSTGTWYSQDNRPVSLAKQELITSMIDEGSSVLDIGCGDGNLLQYLSREKKIKAFGVDVSSKAVDLRRKRGIEAQVADLTKEGFQLSGTYDYAVISEVLEHLPNPEQLMFKLKGKVKMQ